MQYMMLKLHFKKVFNFILLKTLERVTFKHCYVNIY